MTYPLERSRWQTWVLAGFWLTGVLLMISWVFASQHFGWRQSVGFLAIASVGLLAYRGWKNAPVGQLVWDGQIWRWEGPGYQAGMAEYQLLVAADFKNFMLLRIENQAHAKLWLWADQRAFPSRWSDLRRAVYSPHRAAAIDPGSPSPQAVRSP